MDIQKIQEYKSAFDLIAKNIKDDEGNTIAVWYARELQQVLGYARWENFVVAVGRAMESCKTLGISIDDHFREVTKMVALAKGAQLRLHTDPLDLWSLAYLQEPQLSRGLGEDWQDFTSRMWADS